MTNVIRGDFTRSSDATSHYPTHVTGNARCLRCKHEWVAVVEYANRLNYLVCPGCALFFGLLAYPYEPDAGEMYWRCVGCGNHLLILMRDGVLCPNCGVFTGLPREWIRDVEE